jgi:hypothetical protein
VVGVDPATVAGMGALKDSLTVLAMLGAVLLTAVSLLP